MSTNHHTPIPTSPKQAANAATFNAPLSELDTKITDHETRIGDLETDMPVPSGNPTEYFDGDGNWTVPAGTGASVDGHVIKDDGVALPQRAVIDFVGPGVTVTNEAGGTQVSIPADYLTPDGLKEWSEQASNPSTPAANKWKVYFKAGGLYIIDDAGVVLGPLSTDHGALSGLADDDHPQYSLKYADAPNLAVNGGFEFAQEQTPGTYTTIADKAYGPDQWWVTRENADVQYKREDGTGESGITSKYFGTFKKITNTGKFFICQPLEGRDSVPLRSKTVIFPIKLKASGSKTIRMAVLELQTGGTMDAPPATLVTAFGANGVDPTFGTNVAIITAAQSKAVTTSFQQFSVSVTVPSNSKNLFLAIWSNDQFAANDTLSVAEADFYPGSAVRAWLPKKFDEDLAACRRYFYKTFDIEVAPAQNAGLLGVVGSIAGKAGATALAAFIMLRYPVRMFATPTVTTFNPQAANAQIRDVGASVDCSSTAVGASVSSPDLAMITAMGNASTAVGNIVYIHLTAKARIL